MRTSAQRYRIWMVPLALGFALLPAAAQRGPGGFEKGPEARMERLAERLNLTPEQQEQFQQVFAGHREDVAPLMERKREAGVALREAIRAETFNEAGVREAAMRVAEIDVELAVVRAAQRQQLREVLDPEQLEQLDRLHERRGATARGPGRGDADGL